MTGDSVAAGMLSSRYRVPQPRNALALAVRNHARAAMDVSDGLAGDLTKLCAASGVSADVDTALVPLSAAAARLLARGEVDLEALISGGDDYEILCAVAQADVAAFTRDAGRAGVAVAEIGTVTAQSEPPRFLDAQGRPMRLQRLSFSHF